MARTDLEQLVYQMSADVRQLTAANKRALADVKSTATKAQREYDQLAADMGRSFGKASLAAGVAFGAIIGYATKAASDASETANAFQVAFGKLTPQAQKFAKSYSASVGRATAETQGNMAKTQLVLTGIGIAADQALGLTEAIQRRSVDIGSLWNVEDAEAYQAILSGIAGEAEPLKKFGVALNDAALKQELLRLGFKGNAQQAPEAAKAIARLNIIMKASASADGDAIKTKDGLANSVKSAKAEFQNAAVELGQQFLPLATEVAHKVTDMLTEFNKLPDSVKLGGLALLGLVASAGPIAKTIEGLVQLIKFAGAARVALLGVTAAQTAGGAAGGAAAGAGAGGLAAGGLAGAGVAYGVLGVAGAVSAINDGNYVKRVQGLLAKPGGVRQLSDADISALQERLRKDAARKGLEAETMYGDFGVDTLPAKSALGLLAGEANARAAIAAKKAKDAAAAAATEFALPPGLLSGGGGGAGGAGKGKGKAKIDLKTGVAEVDESTIFDLVNNLGGVGNAIKPVDSNPDGFVSATDRQAAITEGLENSRAETTAYWAETIEGGLWAAKGGFKNLAVEFGRQLEAQLIHLAALQIANSLAGAKGGFAKTAAQFAGFFAGGGTIGASQWGIVNDGAVEAVRAKPGGGIEVASGKALKSLSRPAAVRSSMTIIQPQQSFDLRGAVMTQDILNHINNVGRQSVQQGAVLGAQIAAKGAANRQYELDAWGR
jgi:hypothetical protein